jgi:phosphatidylserine/phosphatidylglycerophosphate/cardiolipin synthase-like enzyme
VTGIDDSWLDGANVADLEALARALLAARIGADFATGSIQLAGFGADTARFLHGFRGTEPRVVAWMLHRLARERARADSRYAGVASLVWSGASEGEESTRDTRVVLDGIFERAERHVLIATYVVYEGTSVFARLAERLRQRPEIDVEVYLNLKRERDDDPEESDDEHAARFVRSFRNKHWPADLALPAMYYDPEARKQAGKRVAMHAKCVVVDWRWAFVTSANFTEAAQERNIEAGVLLDHPKIAEALAARFRALRESGRLRRMG